MGSRVGKSEDQASTCCVILVNEVDGMDTRNQESMISGIDLFVSWHGAHIHRV